MRRLRRLSLPVAALATTSLALLGCSSSEQPSYCDELSATESSFEALVNTDILAEGTDVLTERYDAFAAQVSSLIDAAGDEFADESAAVEASVDQVGAVVDEAANLNLGTAAEEAAPAVEDLSSSTQALLDSVQNAC
jgi:phage-related protein